MTKKVSYVVGLALMTLGSNAALAANPTAEGLAGIYMGKGGCVLEIRPYVKEWDVGGTHYKNDEVVLSIRNNQGEDLTVKHLNGSQFDKTPYELDRKAFDFYLKKAQSPSEIKFGFTPDGPGESGAYQTLELNSDGTIKEAKFQPTHRGSIFGGEHKGSETTCSELKLAPPPMAPAENGGSDAGSAGGVQ